MSEGVEATSADLHNQSLIINSKYEENTNFEKLKQKTKKQKKKPKNHSFYLKTILYLYLKNKQINKQK